MHPDPSLPDVVFGALFSPIEIVGPEWTMLGFASATAFFALLVFRRFSSQEAIRRVKARLKAHILEIRLFRDDPVLMGRAVRAVLAANFSYLRLALTPFLVMTIPMALLLVQMEARFGYRPLLPAEETMVRTSWKDVLPAVAPGALLPSDGLEVTSPPLRIPGIKEIDWKVKVLAPGRHHLTLPTGGEPVVIPVAAGRGWEAPPRRSVLEGSIEHLWIPAGIPLPREGALAEIEVEYPRRDFLLAGRRIHWIWPFLVLSLAVGYLLKGRLGVEI